MVANIRTALEKFKAAHMQLGEGGPSLAAMTRRYIAEQELLISRLEKLGPPKASHTVGAYKAWRTRKGTARAKKAWATRRKNAGK
jgi:hypothetical protein